MLDERSERNILTLLPAAREAARGFMSEAVPLMASKGFKVIITGGSRTYAEQDALYAQGRTKPGAIVTNAKAGESWHNFAIAFDVTVFQNGKMVSTASPYHDLGALAQKHGLEWGGNWKTPDMPHFQLATGLTLAQARAKVAAKQPVA